MKSTPEDYIGYRLKKARKTFTDAKSLAELKSWDSSMNRLYFACFYGVLALFAKHQISSRTHSGVKSQLSSQFIKTGILDKEDGMLYGDLFDFRQKGDYGDFFSFEEEHITSLIPKVEEFIGKIENLVKKS